MIYRQNICLNYINLFFNFMTERKIGYFFGHFCRGECLNVIMFAVCCQKKKTLQPKNPPQNKTKNKNGLFLLILRER